LQQALQQAGAAMYQAGEGPTGGPGQEGPSTDGKSPDEDVIEGEFSDAN
jgi:hypothetical protein